MSFSAFCKSTLSAVKSSVDFLRSSTVFSSWVILFVCWAGPERGLYFVVAIGLDLVVVSLGWPGLR